MPPNDAGMLVRGKITYQTSEPKIFQIILLLELKEIFNLYDEEADGTIDGSKIGEVARAAGLKPTRWEK